MSAQTYDKRPLELGRWGWKCLAGKPTYEGCDKLHIEIEYPDEVYEYEATRAELKSKFLGQVKINDNFIVDNAYEGEKRKFVYAYSVTSTIPGIGEQKERRYLGFTAEWQKPENQYGTPISLGPGVEPEIPIISEYGNPVIGPDGSIYCWMRSETHYKILKWTWTD